MSATVVSDPHGARNEEENLNNVNHFENVKLLSNLRFAHLIPTHTQNLTGRCIAKPKIFVLKKSIFSN
jgi:hypothetical protein